MSDTFGAPRGIDIRTSPFLRVLGLGMSPERVDEERSTDARSAVMQELAKLQAQDPGMQPNELLGKLLPNPAFVNALARDPNYQKTITEMIGALKPSPQVINSGEGNRVNAITPGARYGQPPTVTTIQDAPLRKAGPTIVPENSSIFDEATGQWLQAPGGGGTTINNFGQKVPRPMSGGAPNIWGDPQSLTPRGQPGWSSFNAPQAPPEYEPLFAATEQKHELPPGIVQAVGYQESRFNPRALGPMTRNHGQAKGMMQFIDTTAGKYGIDPYVPEQAIDAAGKYLKASISRHKGNIPLALADYNWGNGNVDDWIAAGSNPARMPAQTRGYIAAIMGPQAVTQLSAQGTGLARPVSSDGGAGGSATGTVPLREAVFGMGTVPTIGEFVHNVFGQFFPKAKNLEVSDMRGTLRDFQEKVIDYYETSGRAALQEQARVMKLAPGLGLGNDPTAGIQQLLRVQQTVQNQVDRDWNIVEDVMGQPTQNRIEAQKRIDKGQAMLAEIGNPKDLRQALAFSAKNIHKQGEWGTLWSQLSGGIDEASAAAKGASLEGPAAAKAKVPDHVQRLLDRLAAGENVPEKEITSLEKGDYETLRRLNPRRGR